MPRLAHQPAPAAAGAVDHATWWAGALIVLAVAAAYANSLQGAFVLDDVTGITENESLRHLRTVLLPAGNLTTGGRPLVNLSLAANYAAGGLNVPGYHVVNILIHACAALALFGVVRRTLLLPALAPVTGSAARSLALVSALLWALHPLQTESVSYVIQRAESLMGLCALLTFYAFIRGATAPDDTPAGRRWLALSVAACAAGMASKEVMVAGPLLVLLHDRTFLAGSFFAAWRQRRGYYLGLAATWLLLGLLVASTHGRGNTAGFGAGLAWEAYARTQLKAVVLYLRLSFWPDPLVLDYGQATVAQWSVVAGQAVFLALAGLGTLVALVRRPAAGFLGAWFFAFLAPSSSIVPVATQTMAEHRMYLSLAAVVTGTVLAARALAGRQWIPPRALLAAGLALVALCGVLTARRNADYRTEESLWLDTARKCPDNARAHLNLGEIAFETGRLDESLSHFTTAVQLAPDEALAQAGLGTSLATAGRSDEALGHLQMAVRLRPDLTAARHNLAKLLEQLGRPREAIAEYQAVLLLDPRQAEVHQRLGNLFYQQEALPLALVHFQAAARLKPDLVPAHNNLGVVLLRLGRAREAIVELETVLQLQPGHPQVRHTLQIAREQAAAEMK